MPITEFKGQHAFLSNFSRCAVTYWGIEFPTVENAYQAAKCLHEAHMEQFARLTPGQSKRLGKRVLRRPDWESVKLDVMEGLLRQKFGKLPYDLLLESTGHQLLIEGNTWGDTFWGVCNGIGENHLGVLLMKIRNDLRGEL